MTYGGIRQGVCGKRSLKRGYLVTSKMSSFPNGAGHSIGVLVAVVERGGGCGGGCGGEWVDNHVGIKRERERKAWVV